MPMSSRRPSREEPTTAKAYSSTSRRPSTVDVDNSNRPRTIKEFSPVILVRPSTFIQAMSAVSPAPPISNNQASKNQDRIPSRFRRAMNVSNATSSSASMTRSKSIHELNDASLGSRAANLQDKIRQAKSDHQKVFDDARSHTHYTRKFSSNGTEGPSRDSRASSHQPEWVAKAHSMRSLRASPIGDYRRLHLWWDRYSSSLRINQIMNKILAYLQFQFTLNVIIYIQQRMLFLSNHSVITVSWTNCQEPIMSRAPTILMSLFSVSIFTAQMWLPNIVMMMKLVILEQIIILILCFLSSTFQCFVWSIQCIKTEIVILNCVWVSLVSFGLILA